MCVCVTEIKPKKEEERDMKQVRPHLHHLSQVLCEDSGQLVFSRPVLSSPPGCPVGTEPTLTAASILGAMSRLGPKPHCLPCLPSPNSQAGGRGT